MRRFKSAWVRQLPAQVKLLGEKAPWYVHWKEPDGRKRCESCGPGTAGRKKADQRKRQIESELFTETYARQRERLSWAEFQTLYEQKALSRLRPTSRTEIMSSLKCFGRIAHPRQVNSVTAEVIAEFTTKRQQERGRKPGSLVSKATVNKDLRNVRGALRTAAEWGYLEKVPRFKFLAPDERLPRFVEDHHFAAIYQACAAAALPGDLQCTPTEWWRGLLIMARMTGWRIGELLTLRWQDVDLNEGFATTRGRNNKGRRDAKVPLHPLVVEHLQVIRRFDELVFPWTPNRRTLDDQYARIQDAAGIHLACPEAGAPEHGKCTAACHRYSFHDERRAFATFNAPHMTREALQALMRHRSPNTTDRYINMARQLKPTVAKLHVPEFLADVGS